MASSPEQILRELESSELFAPDFPRRRRYTHCEWASLSEDERHAAHEPGRAAMHRMGKAHGLADLVRRLGAARYEPATPLLAKLWSECSLVPVRNAAGHALREIGTLEAWAALEASIDDADHLSTYLAVMVIFADPARAFDRLSRYFEKEKVQQKGGSVIPNEVLAVFLPSTFRCVDGVEVPDWMGSLAPRWFLLDRRWLDLCVGLRHDEHLGSNARSVLRYADASVVEPALEAACVRDGSPAKKVRSTASGDLLARYLRGEHEAVWRELRQAEAMAGEFRAEAVAVARQTMLHVARNADVLAERLSSLGWRALSGELRTRPRPEDDETLARLAQITGTEVPPSIAAFWQVAGGIDLVWDYAADEAPPRLGPDLAMYEMDPLCVAPAASIEYLFEEWADQRKGVHPELQDPFSVDVAPDYLHKANVSGGAPYGFELPFTGADPIFMHEEHELPFVDYLRLCFRWGGFPRLERHGAQQDVRSFVSMMTKDLEPF